MNEEDEAEYDENLNEEYESQVDYFDENEENDHTFDSPVLEIKHEEV